MTNLPTHQARPLLEVGCELAEGPLPHSSGDLLWVDILRGHLYRWDGAAAPVRTDFDEPISAVAETVDAGLLVATRSSLVHVDPTGRRNRVADLPHAAPDLRTNDGKADPFNRFVVGTMAMPDARPGAGSLWSFGVDGPVELLVGVTVSNGLAWSADGSTMFYIDTPTRRVDAFAYDGASGSITDRRTAVRIDEGQGDPDGMCIDVEGGLWVALWGGGAVHRYVDGELAAVVEVPTPYVTSVAFTGPAGDELVITTAAEPFTGSAPRGAGDLYTARVGTSGAPPHRIDPAGLQRRS